MQYLNSPALPQTRLREDVTVSYDKYGSGPPLVLVHGSFSDHKTNWAFVKPLFEQQFTVYAIARRGRGETVATIDHSLNDESQDVVALIQAINEPVFLLGHSYGAQVALAAAVRVPDLVSKLVLYEAPHPHAISQDALTQLKKLAQAEQWEDFVVAFFRDTLLVPVEVLDELRTTEDWQSILTDAKASLGDIQALVRYDFNVDRFRELQVPVLLQIGTESPRDLYITDALAAALPNARIEALPDQAHEGMTTAPQMYAEAVSRFLLGTFNAPLGATVYTDLLSNHESLPDPP
jgi:pimeloyl-ACP methyl ester carboxylesterase